MRGISVLAIALGSLVAGFASAILVEFHASAEWPEFFGALTAALIAAAALIFGSYYQDKLTRRRDEKLNSRERISEAIDLCFWLQHCDAELEFIEGTLNRTINTAAETQKPLEISSIQFRDIISSHFYGELLDRAKVAARLPSEISGLVTSDLYRTFSTVDRAFIPRQATKDYSPSPAKIQQYILVIGKRREALQRSAKLIEIYLIRIGALPPFQIEGE